MFPFQWGLVKKSFFQLSCSIVEMDRRRKVWVFFLKVCPGVQRNFQNIMIRSGKAESKETQQNRQRQNLGVQTTIPYSKQHFHLL